MFCPRFYRLTPRAGILIRNAKSQAVERPAIVKPSWSTTETKKSTADQHSLSASKRKAKNNANDSIYSKPDVNELGIPMISADLHRRLFGCDPMIKLSDPVKEDPLKDIRSQIAKAAGVKKEELSNAASSISPDDTIIELPELCSKTIDGHFVAIAEDQIGVYRDLAKKLASCKPPISPTKDSWVMKPGWSKYGNDGSVISVDFPEEDSIVFDVEVCLETKRPTLAVAMSEKAWYSWCSKELCRANGAEKFLMGTAVRLEDFIPLETKPGQDSGFDKRKKLVIGHNVAFDRSYVKEQYYLERTDLRFLDTMSMHIATSGFCSVQRDVHLKKGRVRNGNGSVSNTSGDEMPQDTHMLAQESEWETKGSTNSLSAVHLHYCPRSRLTLQKETRNVFVTGKLEDVRAKFAECMKYCAEDVLATFEVFSTLLPEFLGRFHHPVTLSGMMEMGTAYLPINENWFHFVDAAEESYNAQVNSITKKLLVKLANEAVGLLKDDQYRYDPWLWDEDWSIHENAGFYKKASVHKLAGDESSDAFVTRVWDTFVDKARKAQPYLPLFPRWYTNLCKRPQAEFEKLGKARGHRVSDIPSVTEGWGPREITMQMRITPKLLRMHYKGYPLHFNVKHGWGYLVPKNTDADSKPVDLPEITIGQRKVYFPLGKIHQVVSENHRRQGLKDTLPDESSGPECDGISLPGVSFFKLPHKDGFGSNVGSPLAKDFLHLIENGTLQSQIPEHAQQLVDINRVCSYWKITRDRVMDQLAILFDKTVPAGNAASSGSGHDDDFRYGAIIPRVITSGTVTRRAVEPLWMTASNAKEKRIGSELKSMVQAPPGHVFVGADVDSQELWIASLLGDSRIYGIHGCTPFSWMLLRGDKADGTDQHSMVAKKLGVSRDEAKVLNYGRIYGAGLPFATVLLKKFRPGADDEEIQKLARRLYATTKGMRRKYCKLTDEGVKILSKECGNLDADRVYSWDARKALAKIGMTFDSQYVMKEWSEWEGGTESEVFNRLEEIALSDTAATPVLGCRLSRTLELGSDNKDFLPSRVNWVVQSSAVDYLHLMLVCMRWLFDKYNIDGRFSISIHDEVRYLVAEKDKYRAALALQITNLLTRAMFVSKVGMTGLPRSVAFFNKVDIDKALRKEVYMDATTPSNQLGLKGCYDIPKGDALDIKEIVEKTGGGRLDNV